MSVGAIQNSGRHSYNKIHKTTSSLQTLFLSPMNGPLTVLDISIYSSPSVTPLVTIHYAGKSKLVQGERIV